MEWEETLYGLELLEGSDIVSGRRLALLKIEVGERSAIFVTLIKQAKAIQSPETREDSATLEPSMA